MRRWLVILAALLSGAVSAYAYEPRIRDIDISASLHEDGSALVTEKWNVTVASGTEWYLVRGNLGAADIKDLNVFDENGQFTNVGRWDIDASLLQKTGKCGLNPISGGYEICWGVGSYGDHRYTVMYRLTDAVDLLNDADCFHFQMVSPGLSSTPEHVKVSISVRGTQLDTSLVKFWGFGYNGTTCIENGAVCFESDGSRYTANSSVIALLRFDKGLFDSGNRRDTDFAAVKKEAFKGADFGKIEDDFSLFEFLFYVLILFLSLMLPFIALIKKKRDKRKILGCKPSEVTWSREVPYEGSLCATQYTLGKLGENCTSNNIAAAMMLRMIYKGILTVQKNAKGKTEFAINTASDRSYMGEQEQTFYDMLATAAGEDSVLQDKEFSKWARKNSKALYQWSLRMTNEAVSEMSRQDCALRTAGGQVKAREALGFKKFLTDFTRMQEKQSLEAVLWQEYLVFAAMFGIAEKVAKEMKDINPDLYTQATTSYVTCPDIYILTNDFGRAIANGINAGNPSAIARSSWAGTGGSSSFGGGGGFHGGGFGGGSR